MKMKYNRSTDEKNDEDARSLADLSLDFVNTRYQAFLCIQLVTFKNATSEEYFGRLNGDEPVRLWKPKGIDVQQWADVLIESKMAGGLLTTKHHGGFCLWDSKYTDYDIASSPVKEDVVRLFVDEFRKRGLKIGLYYSILDYHHGIENGSVTPDELQFLKNQITELLTNYGPIDYINFDGWSTWPTTPTFDDVPYSEIYKTVKAIQPNCLIVNHQYESNLAHADIPFADAAGRAYPYHRDYMRPTAGSDVIQQNWFWDDNNFFVSRSKEYILKQLDSYNSHNGVYILNISPNTNWRLPDDAVKCLKEVADEWNRPAPIEKAGSNWSHQYDVSENLAFMGSATQSSTHSFINDKRAYPRAEIAIDGVTEGNCMMEQTSWTQEEENPWWRVDLGGIHKVKEISIYNRTDAAKDQLSNYTVSLLNAKGKVVWQSLQTKSPNPSVTIATSGEEGRYVRIELNGMGSLALAEVIVR